MSRHAMTWPEWCAYAESTLATDAQVGTVAGHMGRLGYTSRAERLAMTARLLGLGELGSTKDLTLGQAGRLCGLLPGIRDRDELEVAVAIEHERQGAEHAHRDEQELLGQDQQELLERQAEHERGVTLAQAITASLALALRSWQEWQAIAGASWPPVS